MDQRSDGDAERASGWEVREHTRCFTLLEYDWEEPTVEVSADDLIVEETELVDGGWREDGLQEDGWPEGDQLNDAAWDEDTVPELPRPPSLPPRLVRDDE